MEGVGAMREKLLGLEGVMALDGDVGEVGIGGKGLDVEHERWGEGAMTIDGVTE
jgi:hypothetical protein